MDFKGRLSALLFTLLVSGSAFAQQAGQKVVVVTGARFSYELVQKWIDEYQKSNPEVQVIIEARGSNDPLKYDVLAEVYPHDATLAEQREYVNIGRYAILPVANSNSKFAAVYKEEGLTRQLITQIFFDDIFADKEKEKKLKAPVVTYTRLQKAGVPQVFSKYFGFQQKDIKGNTIAGADAHLLKAVLRDSAGVTYLPTPLIYDSKTGKPIEGLAVLPVDLNGNGKLGDDEKFYDRFEDVAVRLEVATNGIKNIPVEYLHLSVDKNTASAEAIDFVRWVTENGQKDLHQFGYLQPEEKLLDKEKFNAFASKKRKQ